MRQYSTEIFGKGEDDMPYTEVSMYVPSDKYSIKCPYGMTPSYITVHNTANDASARNEASYMRSNNNKVSFHDVVDDKEVVHCIPHSRNAWHAGDGGGSGNRKSVGIEICYSKSGGSRFIAAEKNAAAYIAKLLKQKGWDISRVKRHYDWSGKNCPHRTMAMGWQRFLDMITKEMGETASGNTIHTSPSGIDVIYRAYAGGKWWDEVMNYGSGSDGYAGVIGKPLKALQANTKGEASKVGKLKYRLRRKDGRWFNWQTDREKDRYGENFAGNKNEVCDILQMTLTGISGYAVKYRAYSKGSGWLPWVVEYNNTNSSGYVGIKGAELQGVQIQIIKR